MKTMNHIQPSLKVQVPLKVISDYAVIEGITDVEATCRARELEKFLFLCAHAGHSCAPSPAIDSIWHDFILHTMEYSQFCSANFGFFIHHKPSRGTSPNLRESYIATIESLRNTFGDVNESIWPHSEAYLTTQACCSQCAH